jgi:outer membrane protein assembly factor BamB
MKTGVGRKLFRIALVIIGTCSAAAAFEVKGLSVPESFIVDYSTGRYFISNVNGGPTEKNGAGFITRLNPDGSVAELKFIEGGKNKVTLNAPKGLLLLGENLYASDIDHVRGFNKSTGRPTADFNLTSLAPQFLNDLAADSQGRIYVTDMGTDRIFRIDPASGKANVFAEGAELGSPNGLVFLPQGRFFLVTWGTGRLYSVSLKGGLKPASREMFANLDGVDFDDEGNIFFSSFTGGKIYRLSPRGEIKTVSHGLVTPADISLDRKKRLILVPSFNGNRAFTLNY